MLAPGTELLMEIMDIPAIRIIRQLMDFNFIGALFRDFFPGVLVVNGYGSPVSSKYAVNPWNLASNQMGGEWKPCF